MKHMTHSVPEVVQPNYPALWLAILLITLCLLMLSNTALAQAPDQANAPAQSLSLQEARQMALGSTEQLAQMRQAVIGAQADVMASRAGALPQVNLGGTWTHNFKKPAFFLPEDLAEAFGGETAVEMGGDWDLEGAATLTMNLWTAGRLSAAKGMAQQAHLATQWQERVVTDAVIFMAESAYYNVLLAQEELTIALEALTLAKENLRVIDQANQQGRASRFDLLRAKVEVTNRETPAVSAANELQLQTLQLLRVCGLPPHTSLALIDTLQAVSAPEPLTDLLNRMHQHSAELKALEHSVQAARLSVNLAKAGRGPVVQLQGQYALQGQWDDNVFPESDDAVSSASAALAVSIPIFDGFTAKSEIQGSQADLRTAQLELERVQRDRDLGVHQARAYLENAIIALEGRREGVEVAQEAYRLAVVRLENGLATPLERLDAELALTEAQVQLAGALYSCNMAEANLKLSVGGVYEALETSEEIN